VISIDILIAQVSGLERQDLERWIVNKWVLPDRQSGMFVFHEIDVARVKLIRQLHRQVPESGDASRRLRRKTFNAQLQRDWQSARRAVCNSAAGKSGAVHPHTLVPAYVDSVPALD
jgi:hypothetical protein